MPGHVYRPVHPLVLIWCKPKLDKQNNLVPIYKWLLVFIIVIRFDFEEHDQDRGSMTKVYNMLHFQSSASCANIHGRALVLFSFFKKKNINFKIITDWLIVFCLFSTQVIYMQAFVMVILMGKLFKKVFFGQLRAAEMEVSSFQITFHSIIEQKSIWTCSDGKILNLSELTVTRIPLPLCKHSLIILFAYSLSFFQHVTENKAILFC